MKNPKKYFNSFAGILLILAILILGNLFLNSFRMRIDMTQEKINTLSRGTKHLLSNLEKNVILKYYFSKSNRNVPAEMKQFSQRIVDLLREYEVYANGRLILEIYDPKPDSDEEEWAQKYGLEGKVTGVLGMRPNLYCGLVAVSGRKEASIPFISQSMESRLEYLITRSIVALTDTTHIKIGLMSSLPLMSDTLSGLKSRRAQSTGWAIMDELDKQYDIEEIESKIESVPDRIGLLLLIHPKNLSKKTLFAIDQYLLKGGRLLAFLDPLCISEQESAKQGVSNIFQTASEIDTLVSAWGLHFTSREVVADYRLASNVSFDGGGSERMPTWLTVDHDHMDSEEIVTASLESLMMPFSGAFPGEAVDGLEKSVLVFSSNSGSLVNAYQAIQPGADKMRYSKTQEQLPLVVRLKGIFKTAFPDGVDVSEDGNSKMNGLMEGQKEAVVVLVGDVDMLYDRFSLRKLNVFGQTLYQPINDNFNFVLNVIEQMSGSDVLIGLRSRGIMDRSFDKVKELEEKAQKRWQKEELKLVDELREAQSRLRQLEQQKDSDQRYILSPEQEREIESFRKKRFEMQRKLKEVRKNLRKEIEGLGTTIKTVNIVMVPVLISLLGLVYGLRRKKKTQGG